MRRVVLLAALLGSGISGIAQTPAQHLRVSLVSATATLQAGSTQELGIHFQLDPGWHIYWSNPGDSGEPPKLTWHLPSGFTVGELKFPTPKRIEAHTLTDYGYQDDVVLLADMAIPKTYAAKSADVSADIRWLVCREVCIPGRGSVALSLPAGKAQAAESANVIRDAERKLPQAAPTAWKLSATQQNGALLLTIRAGHGLNISDFLPAEPLQIENGVRPTVHKLATGAQITLKPDPQAAPIKQLRGVLVTGDGSYWVTFPVSASSKHQLRSQLRGSTGSKPRKEPI
jgi:DsbC/DsbD-like thiol-disulfide interchange protein